MQIESRRATTFPDARFAERVLHLRVTESVVDLASAPCSSGCRLPVGWEGLIAHSDALQVSGGSVQVLPIGVS